MSATNVSPQALKHGIDQLLGQVDEARTAFNQLRNKNNITSSAGGGGGGPSQIHLKKKKQQERDLQALKKKVSKLKSLFPFSLVIEEPTNPSDSHINWRDRFAPHSAPPLDKSLHNLKFIIPPTFQELDASVGRLKNKSRICLICFLVFPAAQIIKKSILACWAKVHEIGFFSEQINELVENGLIHLVYKDTLTLGGYWMHHSVHSLLTAQKWLQTSNLGQWVHVDTTLHKDLENDILYEKDIFHDDPAQILATKELRILHLGNWRRSSVRHIEVQDPDLFFKDMARLSKLRYVSLRGISLVTELPKFITELESLEILDLKACHNLEVIPSDIGNLQSCLTHLDMSECYFLEHMPTALSRLHRLRVLKGFVVRKSHKEKSCTLQDLLSLTDLMKLNVYTNVNGFPDDDQLSTLKKFKCLRSLTISWGGCSTVKGTVKSSEHSTAGNLRPGQEEVQPTTTSGGVLKGVSSLNDSSTTNKEISFNLEKLDLQCVPETVPPNWLKPTNFKHLKNLYIRGGHICDLGQQGGERTTEEYQWSVEILRLKHLENLKMDYTDLLGLFPKLICLEKVECPNLMDFPDDGVWKFKL